jgi:Flp pilus assembly protein TadD
MKNSNIDLLSRNVKRQCPLPIAPALMIAIALMIGNQSFADEPGYRVLLEDVPGADEIEAGNTETGIEMLEEQLAQVEQKDSGDIWSTLCAAYIKNLALVRAERACNKAVEIEPTYYALNNRGVLRVYKGDLSGAREDFERARPPDMEAYLERLKTNNVRLVAAGNFDLLNQLLAKRSHTEGETRNVLSAAKIEDLRD